MIKGGILISLDFGTKSIGVAVGQRITGTAQPLAALKANNGRPNWVIVEDLLKVWQPERVIVGLPLNIDGTEQVMTKRVRKFANKIHSRFGVIVKLHDEYLSTVEAKINLLDRGKLLVLNKSMVDSTSAVIILESFFQQGF